jgi:hypothetical protein
MLIWFVFGIASAGFGLYVGAHGPLINSLLLFILLLLLGWKVFGAPLHGG